MEPKQPIRRVGPEFTSSQPPSQESWQGIAPERSGEQNYEEQPRPPRSVGENELPAPIIPVAQPQPEPTGQSSGDGAVPTSDAPLTAADDDVIEKEWVDKAKKIVSDTKGDPYRREYEVGRLQADYLEKRYGKKLGGVISDD